MAALLFQLSNIVRGMAVLLVVAFTTPAFEITSKADSPVASLPLPEIVEKLDSTPLPKTAKTVAEKQVAQTGGDQYNIEPHPSGEEGFYILTNAPVETMSSKDDLNNAVNDFRANHGMGRLNIDEGLCSIAEERAREAESEFSHAKFEEHAGNGDYNHVGFSSIGENLWQGSFSGVHIVEFGWDKSEGHRANLLGNWTRGCAGIVNTTAAFIFAR